jgi:hypothetical protein
MNTRLSRTLATALLAIVLSLNVAPSAYAMRGDGPEPGGVRDRIVRFIRDIRHLFTPATNMDLTLPKP